MKRDLRSRLSREALTAVRSRLEHGSNSTHPQPDKGGWPRGRKKDRSLCYGARIFGVLRISYGLDGGTSPPPRAFCCRRTETKPAMPRSAGPLLACALALANAPANAQAGATPTTPDNRESAHAATPGEETSARPPAPDDICRALEQSAAVNALPVEFFARVIWQESRFDARAVSPKGAEGIAQFMPSTASWHGLADPFNPIEALRHSAAYLRELVDQFGNLGLAAAAYNAGPGRVSAWLATHRALPAETRNYVLW
jgi:Transglycosylase SLT domain